MLLSQVSVYWRHVAISTPRLWSSMHVWLRTDVSDHTIHMFETWLSRTRDTLLSITVKAYFSSVEAEQIVTHPILELILSCCHRWQRFTFDLPIPLARSLSAVKNRLPCLESLSARYKPPESKQLDAFQNAPRLTDLALGPYTTFSKLPVPWTQLTKFRTSMDLDDVIEILHHSPNLVNLAFSSYSPTLSTAQPLVQFPHLTTLVIDTCNDPANLFDCLVVPRLRNLDVSLVYFDLEDINDADPAWWDWLEPLLSLISRSSCSIQSFTFRTRAIDIDADDLTSCLQAMPALRDLALDLDDHGNNLIRNILCRLIHRSAEPCIIPKLIYLDLNLWFVSFEDKTLIDMIQSRWRMVDCDGDGVSDKPTLDVARLQVVILRDIISERNSDLLVRLRELKDEGMRIDLRGFRNRRITF